ncbi:MAG: hypothetical protein HY692_05250, partial [Cyanobacteria bacterium NC_groundwater_1444_Ag_S-0.65um_54_12]|nr:hypothetical protein [Cyanobacteria bacterium NC_groundwater_1444_Ag_S-0.65um_54_12]
MLETVDPQLLENVDLPPRIERLRARFFSFPPAISIFRARAFTQVARENPALPTVLLKARSFYRACETLPIYIGPDELIVGHPGGQPRAGIFSPEICWRWLDRELDTVGTRPQDPYFVSEADQEILRTEIFPFWRGRSVDEYISAELEELGLLALAVQSGVMDCEVKSTSGGGDLSPGYANVLFTKGYAGIKQDAQARLAQLDLRDHDDIERCHFLKSLVIVCDALALLAGRYADLADALALEAASLGRAEELRRIATVCRRVPAEPPRTLHEALQAIWFGQVALFLEENTSGPSPGR